MKNYYLCDLSCYQNKITESYLLPVHLFYVPRRGLEPPWVAPLAPKASASTNFATSA